MPYIQKGDLELSFFSIQGVEIFHPSQIIK